MDRGVWSVMKTFIVYCHPSENSFTKSMVDSFESTIRFPKKKDTAIGYEEVLRKHDKAIIASYDLVETETELYVTERVNNILFVKK